MNQIEIEMMISRHHECPNVRKGIKLLHALMEAVNAQSDGWAYWQAPQQAARPLMDLLHSAGNIWHDTSGTISDKDLRKAIGSIKRMVTKQKAEQTKRGNKFEFDVDEALSDAPKISDGAAGVIVEYSGGVLTVRHVEGGAVLFTRPSSGKEWNERIFPTLKYPPRT